MKYTSREWTIEDVRVGFKENIEHGKIEYIETPTMTDPTFKICITMEHKEKNHPDATEKITHITRIIVATIVRFTVTRKLSLEPVPDEYLM